MSMISTGITRPALPRPMRRSLDTRGLMAAPALLFMSLVFALPLCLLLAKSVQGADGLTLNG